jgi:periplasmic protein TonB
MEIQQIPNADWLDLLFDGRNKEYGAYDLRKNYNHRLTKAITLMIAVCLVLAGGYTLAGKFGSSHMIKPVVMTELDLTAVTPEKRIETPPPFVPKSLQAAPAVATIRDVTTRIVKDVDVKPDDEPPVNADLDNAKIGLTTTQGTSDADVVPPVPGDGNKGLLSAPAKSNDDDGTVFRKVEIESSYPAGPEGWKRFLIKNFHTPDEAIDQQAGGSIATVVVQFIVDREGNLSDVHAISGSEVLRKEAERVIKKSGKWDPAIQNGRMVSSYKTQPIIVQLTD